MKTINERDLELVTGGNVQLLAACFDLGFSVGTAAYRVWGTEILDAVDSVLS